MSHPIGQRFCWVNLIRRIILAEEVVKEKKPKRVLTPEQLAKREERKKRRSAKEAQFEQDLMSSKEANTPVWNSLDNLIQVLSDLPQEEQGGVSLLVARVFRNRLRPGRKAKSIEKMQKRLEKLKKQQARILQEMGEEVPAELQAYLEEPKA